MPMSPKPPRGTTRIKVTTTLGVKARGRKAIQAKSTGTVSSTVSMALRISNRPNSRPASVKFTGIW